MAQINLSQSQQLQLRQADQIKRLEEPQEATGDVVSPFSSQDTGSDEDARTSHNTNEDRSRPRQLNLGIRISSY